MEGESSKTMPTAVWQTCIEISFLLVWVCSVWLCIHTLGGLMCVCACIHLSNFLPSFHLHTISHLVIECKPVIVWVFPSLLSVRFTTNRSNWATRTRLSIRSPANVLLLQFTELGMFETVWQVKYYNYNKRDHCQWGNSFNSIEYECKPNDTRTLMWVNKEMFVWRTTAL